MGFFPRDSGRIMTLPVILDVHLRNHMIIHLYCFKPLNLVDWVQPYYYKQEHGLRSGNLKFYLIFQQGRVRVSGYMSGIPAPQWEHLEVCFMQPPQGIPFKTEP